jgi:hypothetical protein
MDNYTLGRNAYEKRERHLHAVADPPADNAVDIAITDAAAVIVAVRAAVVRVAAADDAVAFGRFDAACADALRAFVALTDD